MRLKEIVKILKGKLIGEDIEIQDVSSIEDAEKGDITFSLNGGKVKDTKASAIILKEKREGISIPVILVDNPKLAFSKLLSIFSSIKHPCGISKRASISENAKMGDNVAISDFVVVEDGAKIGDSAIIY
ncbi:MAG: LpxD N-terminal domain-containing protein, partial [bacterium]